jgi:hypothetical protein
MGELYQLKATSKDDFRFLIDEFMADYNNGDVLDATIIWRSQNWEKRFGKQMKSVITLGWWSEESPFNILGLLDYLKSKIRGYIDGVEGSR